MGSFSTNQRRALAALLGSSTIAQAADRAGLCESTIYGYLRDPSFKAALRARQDQTIAAAVAALSGLAGEAIDTLKGALVDKEATVSTRVRAALGVLDHVQRLTVFADLEDRVAQLEEKIK